MSNNIVDRLRGLIVATGWPAGPLLREAADEIERLQSALDAALRDAERMRALLPGSHYMDPPDGGDVSIEEQFQRMAKDAARYRWLRENCWKPRARNVEIDAGYRLDFQIGAWPADRGMDLDAAIDAARKEA